MAPQFLVPWLSLALCAQTFQGLRHNHLQGLQAMLVRTEILLLSNKIRLGKDGPRVQDMERHLARWTLRSSLLQTLGCRRNNIIMDLCRINLTSEARRRAEFRQQDRRVMAVAHILTHC